MWNRKLLSIITGLTSIRPTTKTGFWHDVDWQVKFSLSVNDKDDVALFCLKLDNNNMCFNQDQN